MTTSVNSFFKNSFNNEQQQNALYALYNDSHESVIQMKDTNKNYIMPYIYNVHDNNNMTAMTNGISSTPGASSITNASKSPSKNERNINNNWNQHSSSLQQAVYREKESNQHTARGMYK